MNVSGVYTHLATTQPIAALTFDACGGGPLATQVDQELVYFLINNKVPATLFLNARWIDANPKIAADLIANPLFDIGNHGTRHIPLSVNGNVAYDSVGTKSAQEVVAEVWGNHQKLTALMGRPPLFFRSGTAHYDEIATSIVSDLGEKVIGFSINGDAGTTSTASQIVATMQDAHAGSISIAHINHPEHETFQGFALAIVLMRSRGLQLVKLSEVTDLLA